MGDGARGGGRGGGQADAGRAGGGLQRRRLHLQDAAHAPTRVAALYLCSGGWLLLCLMVVSR